MSTIVEQLKAAADAVEEADLAEDLRVPAFVAAFWSSRHAAAPARARTTASKPRAGSGRLSPSSDTRSEVEFAGDESEQATTIAAALGLEIQQIRSIYDLGSGEPGLLIAARFLPDTLRAAASDITYLIVAARQALGEEWTATEVIKDVTEERGFVDKSRNLAKLWPELEGRELSLKRIDGRRAFKMSGPGFTRAAEIATKLAQATA